MLSINFLACVGIRVEASTSFVEGAAQAVSLPPITNPTALRPDRRAVRIMSVSATERLKMYEPDATVNGLSFGCLLACHLISISRGYIRFATARSKLSA